MDKKDYQLLYALEKDSRQHLTKIAKSLKTSQQVVSYRLQQLEKEKIITQYYAIIDFAKLGYSNYRTMIRLGKINNEEYQKLIEYFRNHQNVLWIVECGGRWDLIVNILAKNPVHYNNLILVIRNKFKEIIQDYELLLTIEGAYLGREYLVEKERILRSILSFGKEIDSIKELDKIDLQILSLLASNARLNSIEIGNKLAVTNNTIILRIKQLKKKELIQGFSSLIHLEKIGYQAYKALIKLEPISEEKEKSLINHLSSDNNIVGILRMIGSWNLEIEFEVKTREEMLKLTREIRTKFKDFISEFEVLPLFHEYKYNYFPGDLLEESKNKE